MKIRCYLREHSPAAEVLMTMREGMWRGDGGKKAVAVVFLALVALSVIVSATVLISRGRYVDVVGLRGG